MHRFVPVAFLLAAIVLTNGPVRAQPSANKDAIAYFDRKEGKVVTVTDTAVRKESAAGVEIPSGTSAKFIPAPDIVRIDYGGLPGLTFADLSAVRALEETDDPAKVQARYGELLKKVGGQSPKTKRYLAFREAMAAAGLADRQTKPDEFRPEAERAAKLLAEFAEQNDKSWEVWPAARTAARLRMELGDFAGAAAILGKLAKNPDLTADLRADVRLAEAAARLRAGESPAWDEIERDPQFPTSGPARQKLAVLKVASKFPKPVPGSAPIKPADAVAAMEKAIADAADQEARATGFNFLGDLYRAHGLPRDAMWAYLWVDVVYAQDKDERVIALHRLAEAFEAAGDADRAAQFRDKLPTAR